ncbi:MAG: hypothetical protein WC378_00740 [Opitutaceae bacterium]|jgi:hypothetical protein
MGKASQQRGLALRRATKRALSEKQTQGHHAARQGFREQSELDARLMAEDEDIDLWEPETGLEGDDTLDSLGFDSDVDLTDDDEVPPSDAEAILPPTSLAEANLLIVHEGRAISQPPDWNLGLHPSAWTEERSLRFAMLERVAAWFTEERTSFLRAPVSPGNSDPLLNFSIGKTDLAGPIPVLEEGLLTATDCDVIGDYSTFNRHIRYATLKWTTGYHLPVAELLSHQSRIAWVAAAILDLRRERSINLDLLRGKLTVPKGKDSDDARAILRRIPVGNPRKAAPKDYAIAACLKVQVAWDKVIQKYEELIFNP